MKRPGVGTIAVLLAGALWGTTGTAASFAPSVPPIAIGAFAMGVGGLLQALIAVPALYAARSGLRSVAGLVVIGAGSVAIYPPAFYASMRLAGVAVGTVISIASAPVFSAVLERVIDGAPLSRRWFGAAALAIVGSAALCLSHLDGSGSGALPMTAGAALGLVAGATYALYTWVVQRVMRRGVPRPAAMGAVFGVGGLALMPVLVATGAPILTSTGTLSVAIYMAVVPMFLGYVLFGIGLARVRSSTATVLTLCEPAVAAILAVAIVGERLSPLGWSGLALIGGGLVALTVPGRAASGAGEGAASP